MRGGRLCRPTEWDAVGGAGWLLGRAWDGVAEGLGRLGGAIKNACRRRGFRGQAGDVKQFGGGRCGF